MKRTLVTAAAAALLLAGCATGETGHLDPEITPDIAAPLDAGGSGVAGQTPDVDDEADQNQPAGDAGVDDDVVDGFDEAAAQESWYAEVVTVDVEGPLVLVSTRLLAGDPAALEVCETAFTAAQDAGLTSVDVEVVDEAGTALSQRDEAAGDDACAVAAD